MIIFYFFSSFLIFFLESTFFLHADNIKSKSSEDSPSRCCWSTSLTFLPADDVWQEQGMSACSLPVKVGYTNADALFSLFCKLQKSGPTFIAARSHEAGRGEWNSGRVWLWAGAQNCPMLIAADTLCGTLENGENVHFVFLPRWRQKKRRK